MSIYSQMIKYHHWIWWLEVDGWMYDLFKNLFSTEEVKSEKATIKKVLLH